MEDIILGGVSLTELKAIKAKVTPEAAKFVSKAVDEAKELVNQALQAESQEDVDRLCAEAADKFEAADMVSGITGVSFHIPYYEDWGYDETPLTGQLEDAGDFFDVYGNGPVARLFGLLEDMQSKSRDWHSSRC